MFWGMLAWLTDVLAYHSQLATQSCPEFLHFKTNSDFLVPVNCQQEMFNSNAGFNIETFTH